MVVLNYNSMNKKDNLIVTRIAGGSILKRRPIFSSDGEHIFVLEIDCIRSYSTTSGDCTYEYYPVNNVTSDVVGIAVYKEHLFGVTANGILFKWAKKDSKSIQVSKLEYIKHKLIKNTNTKKVFDAQIVDHGRGSSKNSFVELCLFVTHKSKKVVLYIFNLFTLKFIRRFHIEAKSNPHCITIGGQYDKIFVVGALENILSIYKYDSGLCVNKLQSKNEVPWTVVRAFEQEDVVIGGTENGFITLYYNVLRQKSSRNDKYALYRWHVLPVSDITFTPFGSMMFSGGAERVLVQWDLSLPSKKHFVPRLPAEIVHIVASPSNTQVALALQDNSIVVLNSQLKVQCSIQSFSWGLQTGADEDIFPAGIGYDPISKCLVLNGRPGHIQFFSLKTNSLVYFLDITQTNHFSQEVGTKIYNLEVTKVAFSQDGKWLTTVESRDDHETSFEMCLKMWFFNEADQRFQLNTCSSMAHQKKVNAVKYQPSGSFDGGKRKEWRLVTTGDDNKFRVWCTQEIAVENGRQVSWKCQKIGFYKDYAAGPAGFSSDGSVLAVGFGPCLTIWDTDSQKVISSLTRNSEPLTFVEIEQKHYSHLVASTNSSYLYVWNLLTLRLLWYVELKVSLLIADPFSDFMAAFTDDNKLFVFKPSNELPVYEKTKISKRGKILSAIFSPQNHAERMVTGLQLPQLYFVTSDQELMCLERDEDGKNEVKLKEFNITENDAIKTPFAKLVAKQSLVLEQNDAGSNFQGHIPIGLEDKKVVRELLTAAPHMMPHINLYCKDFLKAFISVPSDRLSLFDTPGTSNTVEVKSKKEKKMENYRKKKLKSYVKQYNENIEKMFKEVIGDDVPMEIDEDKEADVNVESDGEDSDKMSVDNDQLSLDGDDTSSDDDDDNVVKESETRTIKITNKRHPKENSCSTVKVWRKRNKELRKKEKQKFSNSGFVIDEEPDLGLLRLYNL